MKVAITGGHLSPALATIEELEKMKAKIVYFGNKDQGDEAGVIRKMGLTFYHISTGRVHRHSKLKAGLSMLKLPVGWIQAVEYLRKEKPDVCLSFGGYLSVPCVVAAWCLGIPVVTHEQTKQAGLANRFNGWFAVKVAVAFEECRRYFDSAKVVVTGNPVRLAALSVGEMPTEFGRFIHKKTIYVTGGHQGSDTINEVVLEALPQLCSKWNVIHSLGTHVVQEQFEKQAEKMKVNLGGAYLPVRYFSPEYIGAVFDKANLVVTRTGANTCTEIAHLGKPALMIPLPKGQAGEQLANARELENLGLGLLLPESELSVETLVTSVSKMMDNLEAFHADKEVIAERFIIDAARRLAILTAHYAKNP